MDWTRRYATAFALETIKDEVKKTMVPVLKGLGVERIKFLAENNISIWDVSELKSEILTLIKPSLSAYGSLISRLGNEAILDVMEEVITEECPEFSFLPREWGRANIDKWLNLKT